MRRNQRARMLRAAAVIPLVLLASCAGTVLPSPSEEATNPGYGGCADLPLREKFQGWAGKRGAVVWATVHLTGRMTNTENGMYSELAIGSPKMIAGRTLSVTPGWVTGGTAPNGTVRTTRGTEGALWAPNGAAVVVVNPDRLIASAPSEIELQIAPVIGPGVVFSSAGCWGDKGWKTEPFSGELAEVPGSQTADAVRSTLRTYPYAKLAKIAKEALSV